MAVDAGTREKVLHFGKQEFLEKGFQKASLRNIASAAGMTTGAIYTYFKNKNALFEAIVDPVCRQVEAILAEVSAFYFDAGSNEGAVTSKGTIAKLSRIYDFIYAHFDVFRLLVVGAEGSSKADFVHAIVDQEVMLTLAYLKRIKAGGDMPSRLNRTVIHIVSESYINALLEPVRHGMSYEEAVENLEFLGVFYAGGWRSVSSELLNSMI